eukprot:1460826-Pleurochrysis_carterae.AAC.1
MPLKRCLAQLGGDLLRSADAPGQELSDMVAHRFAIAEEAAETKRSSAASPAASSRMRDMSRAAR